MKKKLMDFFQKLSRAFLLPITLISFASMLLGLSSVFLWHDQLKEMIPLFNTPVVQYIANIMNNISNVIMGNVALLFAVSLSFAMAKEDKEIAALGGLVGYMAFLMGMGTLLTVNPGVAGMFQEATLKPILGIDTIDTGLVGGIVVGLLSGFIHNRTHKIKLPMAIAFFGGTRFVPIACSVVFVLLGQVFPFIWASISAAINLAAQGVANTGVFAPFLYGVGERLLIPTGLHHVWNTVIRDTAVSGVYVFPDGNVVEGSRIAYNYYLTTNTLPQGTTIAELVKFLRGGHVPITMFGLPAIALAMYHTAKPENRSSIKPLLITGVFSTLIAAVTEPIEFAFLFASPLLYLIYSMITGLSFMVSYILQTGMGGTLPNLIGLLLYGVLRPESRYVTILLLGIPFAFLCYFFFRWWIVKFDVKTPGRGGEYDQSMAVMESEESDEKTIDPSELKAKVIISGLGGTKNIDVVDCCITRLRVTVKDMSLVNEEKIKTTGCMGLIKVDENNIQIIYGTSVNVVKNSVNKQLVLA